MQPTGTTDDLEPGDGHHASEPATAPLEVPRAPGTEQTLPHIPASSGRDRCGACGAPLAPDQRYCVECGQRRGRSRVEFMEQLAPRAEVAPAAAAPARRRLPRMSANAALIAAVGTLILAMGVGVLIGRSAASEKAGNVPIKVVTIGGGAGTAATTTPATAGTESTGAAGGGGAATTTGGSGTATKSKSAAHSKGSASKAATKTSASSKPKARVVKIGSHGKGAGYNEKEEFTGEFFGKGEE